MSLRETLDPRSSLWTLLACQLWWHRTQRGLSCTDVGKIANCVRQTVSNWEAGRIRIAEDQAKTLDREWNTGGLFELLLWFARTAHDPDWFAQYVHYEATANSIKVYHGQLIPSLLQTPDYARVFLTGEVNDIEAAVASRMARQEIFARPRPPLLWVLLDEEALERPIGGPQVMRAQLAHLLELGALPNVSIRIVPKSVGQHAGLGHTVQLITLETREVGYVGAMGGGRLVEASSEVRSFGTRYDRIGAKASPEHTSRTLIEQAMEAMR
jgi:Domain of unknown function (DUF5753)